MAQGPARTTSVLLANGYWQTQSGPVTTAPGNGKYNADNWASPTMIAIAGTDNDGYDRHAGIMNLKSGDQITELGTNNSQNYQTWTVTSVTDQGTWVQIGVSVIGAGSAFVTPGMNQTRLLQFLQVIAQETPPGQPSARLPNLATPDDIVARLGRSLNQVEMARVDALLADGSAIIRRYCREDFTYHANDSITVAGDGGIINMDMWRPVTQIASVTALSGVTAIADLPVTWYVFDGISEINVPSPEYAGVINLPEVWYEETFWWGSSFRVTGSHGYQYTPDDVMAVLCPAVVSELSTPTQSATLASESIGAYSYSMRRTSGAGLSAALADAGMKTALADYRKSQGTIKVRM